MVQTLKTKYGIIYNLPTIKWKELLPYWEPIARAMVEVITENKFRPYTASWDRQDGIVATHQYWETWSKQKFRFHEAERFVELLKAKKEFSNAISNFNKCSGVDWLDAKSMPLLGNRLYGFYYVLCPIFSTYRDKDGLWLKVNFS